jgi:hypothetical protein
MIGLDISDAGVILGLGFLGFVGGEILKRTGHSTLGWSLDMLLMVLAAKIGLKWIKAAIREADSVFHLL